MSYVLEAILIPAAKSELALPADAPFEVEIFALSDAVTLFARPGRPAFDDQFVQFAATLSASYEGALLVRYDNRVGERASFVFRDQELIASYTTEDELFVELDEEGEPLLDGPRYSEPEVERLEEEDREFEVVVNAIQLGCEACPWCVWNLLQRFIAENR